MMFSHGTHVLFWWRTPYKYEHTHTHHSNNFIFIFISHASVSVDTLSFEQNHWNFNYLECVPHTHTHVTPFNNCHHVLCYAHTTQYIKQELTCKIAFSLSVLNLLNNFSSGPQCMLLTEFQMVSRQNIQP